MDLAALLPDDPLIDALTFLKTAFRSKRPLSQYEPEDFPTKFIPQSAKRYIYRDGDVEPPSRVLGDRYESLVYQMLRARVQAGESE